MLARGTGGAADARGSIAQYDETSPLYGFLLYRRRKVLIKYVPEGTSRLLQGMYNLLVTLRKLTYTTARVAVHFTAVTDKFTPHDTTISIAAADDLSDSALASACSLHTAAPSSSSSNSSRHKLDEITEDNEEGQSTAGDSASTARPMPPVSTPIVVEPPTQTQAELVVDPPETKLDESKLTPEFSHVSIETVVGSSEKENDLPTRTPQRDSFKDYDALFEIGPDPRLSSQTTRPALSDLYADLYAQYNKPKVKLGPRPKPSLDIKRPHTSGSGAQIAQTAPRPVSSLPAGLRTAKRKTIEPKRPKSRDSSAVPSIAVPPPPPVPPIPEIPTSPSYPPKSPASIRSMPVHAYGANRSGGVPTEKLRLMKALELRKKQMKARKERDAQEAEAASLSTVAVTEGDAKAVEPVVDEPSPMEPSGAEEANIIVPPSDEPVASLDKAEVSSKQESPNPEYLKPALAQQFDVGMTSVQSEADDMHSATSACSPTSAQTQGSSCAPSTRPSSISEDEQQIQNEVKPESPIESPSQVDAESFEDEDASVESTPTVVPESAPSAPTLETAAPADPQPLSVPQASISDDFAARKSKRKSMILMPPHHDSDDDTSRRRTNRESMMFIPPPDFDAAQSRRQKRKSMIIAAPLAGSPADSKDRRRFALEPVQISAENSEAEYLSDDSFMEELRGAKFEEAMPVSVSMSKSPITPFFPRKTSMSERSTPQRSISQHQSKSGRPSPDQLTRKPSGPWLTHANSESVVAAKKINVSSGISQRIKALAEKSNRESSASVSPLATPDGSTSIVAQRKSSFFTTPPSGNSPPGKLAQRFSRASFVANKSNSTTPDHKPVLQPLPASTDFNKPPVYNVHGAEKPESVQVTARIVRDLRVQTSALTMPTDKTPLELYRSPIIIDHQKSTRPPSRSKPQPAKAEPLSPRPPSSSHTQDAGGALPRSSSESSWRSFGRRLSESKTGAVPRSRSAHSFESSDEKVEKKEKKDSRTSKLFKRMSSAAAITRKNSATSSMQEDLHTSLPSLREPPPPVQVGDLNIQFPDTLVRFAPGGPCCHTCTNVKTVMETEMGRDRCFW